MSNFRHRHSKNVGLSDLFKAAKTVRVKDWTQNQMTSLTVPMPNESLLSVQMQSYLRASSTELWVRKDSCGERFFVCVKRILHGKLSFLPYGHLISRVLKWIYSLLKVMTIGFSSSELPEDAWLAPSLHSSNILGDAPNSSTQKKRNHSYCSVYFSLCILPISRRTINNN